MAALDRSDSMKKLLSVLYLTEQHEKCVKGDIVYETASQKQCQRCLINVTFTE